MREIDEDIRPNTPCIQPRRRNRDESVRSCGSRWADQQGASIEIEVVDVRRWSPIREAGSGGGIVAVLSTG